MFISKKKFNEAIEKARMEIQEKMWEEQQRRDLYNEFDRTRCDFDKHKFTVDKRLDRLEKVVFCTEIKGIVTKGEVMNG